MSALLEVRHVSKHFPIGGVLSGREIRAVEDASFSVGEAGPEIFTIIGESGSGKTTLARMILGLERPSSGEIVFQGEPVTHPNRRERLAFMAKVQPRRSLSGGLWLRLLPPSSQSKDPEGRAAGELAHRLETFETLEQPVCRPARQTAA